MDRFKLFLLNEDRSFLGKKVNDILTSIQDVQEDMPNLGARHLKKLAEQIVDEIRKILHSDWKASNIQHLKELQKIGVAIQKTIEDKGDLREIIPTSVQAVQTLASKLGVKVNDLQGPPDLGGEDVGQEDFALTGNGPSNNSQQQDQNAGPAGQQMQPPPSSPSAGMLPGFEQGASPETAQNPQPLM